MGCVRGYAAETDSRYEANCQAEEPDDSERFTSVSRWLGLKEPETEVLFNLGGQYAPSESTLVHLLGVLGATGKGDPVDRDIWVRNDPERNRQNTPRTTGQPVASGPV